MNRSLAATKKDVECDCPECQPEAEPVAPILLLSLGGMAIFFSFGLGLAAISGIRGFLYASAVLFAIGLASILIGYRMVKRNKQRKHEIMHAQLENAKCDHCGTQNKPGTKRCEWCGAPLK